MKYFTFFGIGFSVFIFLVLYFLPVNKRILLSIIKAAMFTGLAGCTFFIVATSIWVFLHPSVLLIVNFICNVIVLGMCSQVFSAFYDHKKKY